MAELLPQEEALMSRAREAESAREGAFEQMAPSGDFPVGDLNALVDSLNQVLPMFKLPAYPPFAEDIDGPLPGEFVQQLSMVADAAAATLGVAVVNAFVDADGVVAVVIAVVIDCCRCCLRGWCSACCRFWWRCD